MDTLRTFKISYIPATDTKPMRMRIDDMRYGDKWILNPYSSKMSITTDIAKDLFFDKHNIKIVAAAEYGDDILMLTNNFDHVQ
jgi:hypothetical protein